MAYGIGATAPTFEAALKTYFEPAQRNYMRWANVLLALLKREGTKTVNTGFKYVEHAFQTKQGGTMRPEGEFDPDEFDDCEGAPSMCSALIKLVRWYAPSRMKREAKDFGGEGSMGKPLQVFMDDITMGAASFLDQLLSAGTGNGVLFLLDDAGTDNGDGTWTFAVRDYAGIANQPLGVLLERMHLEGLPLQAADAVGTASSLPLEAAVVVSVDATLGAETITVNEADGGGNPFGAAASAGDIVFHAKRNRGGIASAGDAAWGLPLLVDDGTLSDPFQNVSINDATPDGGEGCHDLCYAPYFKSKQVGDASNPVALTENQLIDMISMAEMRAPGERKVSQARLVKNFFFMNTVIYNEITKAALQLRQLTAPALWTREGVKPHLGVERDAFLLNGYPVFDSPMALVADVFFLNADAITVYQNGAFEGQWLDIGGQRERAVPCTTKSEWVYYGVGATGVAERPSMVRRVGVAWPETGIL